MAYHVYKRSPVAILDINCNIFNRRTFYLYSREKNICIFSPRIVSHLCSVVQNSDSMRIADKQARNQVLHTSWLYYLKVKVGILRRFGIKQGNKVQIIENQVIFWKDQAQSFGEGTSVHSKSPTSRQAEII